LRQAIPFTKEGNCFTGTTQLADLDQVAETLRSPSAVGPLREVLRAVVFFGRLVLSAAVAQQQALDMRYEWSVYQLEYAATLLFSMAASWRRFPECHRPYRRVLDVGTVRTLLEGRSGRNSAAGTSPRFEVVVERPTYDLIIFKVHWPPVDAEDLYQGRPRAAGRGHRAQRQERISQGIRAGSFAEIAESLRSLLERFLEVLRSVEACWVSDETLGTVCPNARKSVREGGRTGLESLRMRAVMMGAGAVGGVRGFRAEQLRTRCEMLALRTRRGKLLRS